MSLLVSFQIEALRANHNGGSLSVKELIALLGERVAPAAQRDLRVLLPILCKPRSRYVAYTAEDPGHGPSDPNPHVTIVAANGRGYHLSLDLRGVVFQITDSDRNALGGIRGFVAPGSVPPDPPSSPR